MLEDVSTAAARADPSARAWVNEEEDEMRYEHITSNSWQNIHDITFMTQRGMAWDDMTWRTKVRYDVMWHGVVLYDEIGKERREYSALPSITTLILIACVFLSVSEMRWTELIVYNGIWFGFSLTSSTAWSKSSLEKIQSSALHAWKIRMMWCDMIWYDMIWYDMIWYDMIWYDMI